jgi:hypothetical protein
MTLADILKDSDYKQAQFDLVLIREFEQKSLPARQTGKKFRISNALSGRKQ